MNPGLDGTINGAWMPTVVFSEDSNVTCKKLQSAFTDTNIDACVFFWTIFSLGMFESKKENKLSYSIPSRAINLPSFHDISEDD
jgi:perosamine synthetase